MRQRHPGTWHVAEEDLARYAAMASTPPVLWSTEAHLAACPDCRARLADIAGPALIAPGWAGIDAALDAPSPGPVERILLAVGVPDHTARLLSATPALRLSWLAAVALTATLVAVVASIAKPVVFLAVAPMLPLVGVAASYGRGIDPTYEISLVAPLQSLRLLLLRCVAVLSANTAVCAAASLALPSWGLAALGWFLPSLALTVLALLLTPRLGPVPAAVTVGLGWAVVVAATAVHSGQSVVFTALGQVATAALFGIAAVALARQAPAFDTSRFDRRTPFRRY
jgi:hypothetical protein